MHCPMAVSLLATMFLSAAVAAPQRDHRGLLTIETGNALPVWNDFAKPPVAVLSNATEAAANLSGELVCWIRTGEERRFAYAGDVPSGGTLRVPLDLPPVKGLWQVTAEPRSGERALTQFAAVDFHARTPPWPRRLFRPGVQFHIHPQWCKTDAERTTCLEAIRMMGAKLTRGVMAQFCEVWRKENAPLDWERSDRLVAALESYGLSINAICYSPPSWAWKDGKASLPAAEKRAWYRFACKPGAYQRFCRELSARYGTRIDYYEFGNEWDLSSPAAMSEDEAVAMQIEGWTGIHAGCPEAHCVNNGWASPVYSVSGGRRASLQRQLMTRAKGYYDAYAIHLHCNPLDYICLAKEILDFRRKEGIAVPWYPNETALSSWRGNEEGVAIAIWKKMSFSFSHGAADYIWYNLRATGNNPNDSEQGYGLVSRDFIPRMGYAAFSGFVSVFGETVADRVLADDSNRQIAEWHADETRRPRAKILSGWDSFLEENGRPRCQRLRVRTDATRVWQADIMNNRREVPVKDGVAAWSLSSEPTALVCEGATQAEIDAADLADKPQSRNLPLRVKVGGFAETPTVVLDKAKCVRDPYEADPENVRRLWKGPQDLSAKVWLGGATSAWKIRAEVTDDVAGEKDELIVVQHHWNGSVNRLGFRPTRRAGARTFYDVVLEPSALKTHSLGVQRLAIGFADDDGHGGVDHWLSTTPRVMDEKTMTADALTDMPLATLE